MSSSGFRGRLTRLIVCVSWAGRGAFWPWLKPIWANWFVIAGTPGCCIGAVGGAPPLKPGWGAKSAAGAGGTPPPMAADALAGEKKALWV